MRRGKGMGKRWRFEKRKDRLQCDLRKKRKRKGGKCEENVGNEKK